MGEFGGCTFFFLSLQLLGQFEWMWLQMCWPHLSRWLSQHHLQIRVPSCVQVIGFSPPECAPPSVLWHTFYCHRLESLISSFSCSHVSSHPSFRYSLDHVLGGVGWRMFLRLGLRLTLSLTVFLTQPSKCWDHRPVYTKEIDSLWEISSSVFPPVAWSILLT